MMDSVSEQRLSQVCPALAIRVRAMSDALVSQGIYIRVVQGLRTVDEQNTLYNQGRTTPGKIVTNCKGGYSYHNFGLGVDCIPSTQDPDQPFAPDWNESHPDWRAMINAGEAQGLNAGGDWRTFKDYPHFQLTGSWPVGAPPDTVRILFRSGGLQAVWNALTIDPAPVLTDDEGGTQ